MLLANNIDVLFGIGIKDDGGFFFQKEPAVSGHGNAPIFHIPAGTITVPFVYFENDF